MAWLCKLIDLASDLRNPRDLLVGDMFFGPKPDDVVTSPWLNVLKLYTRSLSEFYKLHNNNRPPLFVMLPGHNLFCVDQKCTTPGGWNGGWIVNGDAPDITVWPPINLQGLYHGWIQNGIIMPDIEGRVYNQEGKAVKQTERRT